MQMSWFRVAGRILAATMLLLGGCSGSQVGASGDGGASAAADGGAVSTADGGLVATDGGGLAGEWALWPVREQPIYTTTPETVTDTGTGLVWERAVSVETFVWQQAVDHCAGLASSAFGGYSDWRLPAEIELISIIDVTRPGTWVDSVAFPHTPIDQLFWSSTPRAGSPGQFWGARAAIVIYEAATSAQQVRCVRGASSRSGPHYTITTDTVRDNWTALTWQRTTPFAAKGWDEAGSYCRGLGLGGLASGWRLPTYKELLSLVAWRSRNPTYDTEAFPSAGTASFWSASSSADLASLAWTVDFSSGAGVPIPKSSLLGMRCVR